MSSPAVLRCRTSRLSVLASTRLRVTGLSTSSVAMLLSRRLSPRNRLSALPRHGPRQLPRQCFRCRSRRTPGSPSTMGKPETHLLDICYREALPLPGSSRPSPPFAVAIASQPSSPPQVLVQQAPLLTTVELVATVLATVSLAAAHSGQGTFSLPNLCEPSSVLVTSLW